VLGWYFIKISGCALFDLKFGHDNQKQGWPVWLAKWIGTVRGACVGPLAGLYRASRFPCCLPGFDFIGHGVFSFSARFLAGHSRRVGPARQLRGCFLCGAKKLCSSICFLGGPKTRRVSVSRRTKQKPAMPLARKGLPHLAVPARKGALEKEYD
jgi:hypothetical protein